MLFSAVWAGTLIDVNRLTAVYPTSSCDAFEGNVGKDVACSALADTGSLDRDGVTCVLQLSSCEEEVVRRRRNLLQDPATDFILTVVIDVSEEVADFNTTIEAGEIAAEDPVGFRDFVINEWSNSDAPDKEQREQSAQNTTVAVGESTAEVVPPFEDECENDADCTDNPYDLRFCLKIGSVDGPVTTICVQCLVTENCEPGEVCNAGNDCVPETTPEPPAL